MMLNGWSRSAASNSKSKYRYGYKSPGRKLAQLIDSNYGKVIEVPKILIQ